MKNSILLFRTATLLLLFTAFSVLNAQWVLCPDSLSIHDAGDYPCISVVDANTAIVAGGVAGIPVVYRTTNGGINFTALPTNGVSLDLFSVWAKDANTIFAGDGGNPGGTTGGNAKVYKTTNGGVTWTTILSTGGGAGFINGIVFSRTNPNFGIVQSDPPNGVGTNYWVAVTTNGGNNWTITNPPGLTGVSSAQNSVVVVDNLFYGFGLNTGTSRVYLTTDGGTNWNVKPLGVTGGFVSGFAFSSNKTYGIAASNSSLPNISRTVDGGASFSVLNTGPGPTGLCTMKWIPGTSTCYYSSFAPTSNCVRKSSNNGSTWTTMSVPGISGITHMEFVYTGGIVYAYVVAKQGIIYKAAKLVDNITGISSSSQVPSGYSLEQNYPNPFNPATNISYSIPKASFVSIKIHDMLGNELMVVVNAYKSAGRYTETVDALDLASGIYFYTIRAGEFSDTKKMTLIR
jgi:photosystem II stability/assembly factor-like uncharacterized protein